MRQGVVIAAVVVVLVLMGVWRWALMRGGAPQTREERIGGALLCCECVGSSEEAGAQLGTEHVVAVWLREGLTEAQKRHCSSLLPKMQSVEGSLVQFWRDISWRAHAQLRVVDSGSHAPVSTFVAQLLVPEEVELSFHSVGGRPRARTWEEDRLRVQELLEAHKQLDAVLDELKSGKYLKLEVWGYHPERMESRWRAIARSVRHRPARTPAPRCVDWGSNAGFFSVHLAKMYTRGVVVGVEGEAVDEYQTVRKKHQEMAAKFGVSSNSIICPANVHGKEFAQLARLGRWDLQLSLSVFHWFTISNHTDFLQKLGWHLAGAATTFLELPEARAYSDNTGQTRAKQLNRWYGGVLDEQALVVKACAAVGKSCRVKSLGAMFHQTGTVRTLLRVDVDWSPSVPRMEVPLFQKALGCSSKKPPVVTR